MTNEEEIQELKRQLAQAKSEAKVKVQIFKEIAKKNTKLTEDVRNLSKTNHNLERNNKLLTEVVKQLELNYGIVNILHFASQSEKKVNLKELEKLLEATKPNENCKVDYNIGESGADNPPIAELKKCIEENDSNSTDKRNEINLNPSLKDKSKKKKKVHTCGRNMNIFDNIPSEVDHKYLDPNEFPDLDFNNLDIVMAKENIKLVKVRAYLKKRIVVVYHYKDRTTGKLYFSTGTDIVNGGLLNNTTIAASVVDKCFGLPLYRQTERLRLLDTPISDDVLLYSFNRSALILRTIYDGLREYIISKNSCSLDETRLLVRQRELIKGEKKCANGYVWTMKSNGEGPSAVYFNYDPSRGASVPLKLLEGFTGALMVDGYGAYKTVTTKVNKIALDTDDSDVLLYADPEEISSIGILLCCCWAHCRRKYYAPLRAVYQNNPKSEGAITCTTVIEKISKLYEIEKRLRINLNEKIIDEKTFIEQRKKESIPIIDSIKKYAIERLNVHENEIKLTQALNYTLNQLPYLTNYLYCKDLKLDNNECERSIRKFIQIRKNSLFATSEDGARNLMINASIVETCRSNNVDPTGYLIFAYDKLQAQQNSKKIETSGLMPWEVSKEQIDQVWKKYEANPMRPGSENISISGKSYRK
jgi:hypothetical protein